jgi:hypothetical protein
VEGYELLSRAKLSEPPDGPAGELDSEERGITYSKAADVPINEAGEVEDEAMRRTAVKC